MTTKLIDLGPSRGSSEESLPRLHAFVTQLVGEPFRFSRVSYGDELTLHFGDPQAARSPKLKGKLYGAYVLGLRGSSWMWKGAAEPVIISAGMEFDTAASSIGEPLSKEELESGGFPAPESRVLSAVPFLVKPTEAFGLQLRMSDGGSFIVLPAPDEPQTPNDETLPSVADWELATPQGLLSVGPGLEWSFEP